MTTEQDVIVDKSAEEDAAFLAEMSAPEVADAEAPAAEPTEANQAEAPVVERKEVMAGYTEEEIKDAFNHIGKLQKALDSTNGTYGTRLDNQQRTIDELRQERQQSMGALTPSKLKRLSQEFPEIAEMLAEDLNGLIGQGGQAFDPAQIEQIVTPRVQALEERMAKKEQELEIRALTKQHRDWREVATFEQQPDGRIAWKNQQFGQWADKLPAESRQKLLQSNDADFLSEQLTEFKKAVKPRVAQKQSLEAAVIPRGLSGQTQPSELADEEAAFRAEMARM